MGAGGQLPKATPLEQIPKLSGTDVAPAADERNALACESVAELEDRGKRGRPRRLDQSPSALNHLQRGGSKLVVRDEDKVIEMLDEDALWQLERDPCLQPFRERVHFIRDWLTLPPGAIGGWRRFGLHPDHNDARVDCLGERLSEYVCRPAGCRDSGYGSELRWL
jgi:hypothetical protein